MPERRKSFLLCALARLDAARRIGGHWGGDRSDRAQRRGSGGAGGRGECSPTAGLRRAEDRGDRFPFGVGRGYRRPQPQVH